MSDRAPALPPAAVDITNYRAAADAASRIPAIASPARIGWLLLVVVLLLATVALAFVPEVPRGVVAGTGIAALVVLVVAVMLPARRAADRSRVALAAAAGAVDAATDDIVARLASIGYAIPRETAAEWLTTPQPDATVPLVHDSVIAARWWRPADGDDRVFVEAYLRQDGVESMLPALRPLV